MSPDRDARFTQEDPDDDFDEEEAPRSIFSATWFRVVLVLLGIGVVGAVAVPYVLDVVTPTIEPTASVSPTPSPAPVSPAPASSMTAQAQPSTPPSAPSSEASKAPASSSTRPAPAVAAEPPKPSPAPAAKKEPARESAKSDASERSAPKGAVAEKPTPAAEKAVPKKAATPAKGGESGDYFVQVGAFKDQAMATTVAGRLRQMNYAVVESTVRVGGGAAPVASLRPVPPPAAAPPPVPAPRAITAPAGPDRYDVIVSGGSPADMNAKLTAKGLASEPAGDGVRIRPSLPLRDAVALSKDLGGEGFRVQVRRAGSADAPPAPAPAPPPAAAAPPRPAPSSAEGEGQTLYRVRVGGFADRAAAQAVLRELQEKGYQPFIAKGRE